MDLREFVARQGVAIAAANLYNRGRDASSYGPCR